MDPQSLINYIGNASLSTPYVVIPTPQGFRLTLNVADASWYQFFAKAGLRETFDIDVRLNPESKSVETTDTLKRIDWVLGVPHTGKTIRVVKGEVIAFQKEQIIAFNKELRPDMVVDINFATTTMKRWLGERLKEAGCQRKLGSSAKIGIAFAALGVVVAIGAAVIPALL